MCIVENLPKTLRLGYRPFYLAIYDLRGDFLRIYQMFAACNILPGAPITIFTVVATLRNVT